MSAEVNFGGDTTVYAAQDDPIDLGLQIQSGHSGFHALKYDVGAERQHTPGGRARLGRSTATVPAVRHTPVADRRPREWTEHGNQARG